MGGGKEGRGDVFLGLALVAQRLERPELIKRMQRGTLKVLREGVIFGQDRCRGIAHHTRHGGCLGEALLLHQTLERPVATAASRDFVEAGLGAVGIEDGTDVEALQEAAAGNILGEFFDGEKSARETYESYLDRRNAGASIRALRQDELLRAEIDKFIYLRGLLADWLAKATNYSEKEWKKMVVNVILLLFPKYVAVLENVRIADFYSTPGKRKNRFIDLCVVDANGNIDVIEIKKPFDDGFAQASDVCTGPYAKLCQQAGIS